jgi:hypothetical protein
LRAEKLEASEVLVIAQGEMLAVNRTRREEAVPSIQPTLCWLAVVEGFVILPLMISF